MIQKYLLSIVIAVSLIAVINGKSLASVLDNSGVGTTGLSMASAFSGIADDATAVYYKAKTPECGWQRNW